MTGKIDELKIQSLGLDERQILLKALDFDLKKLKCQYCDESVTYDKCAIMPSIKTKLLASILCDSALCMATYLEDYEGDEDEKEI